MMGNQMAIAERGTSSIKRMGGSIQNLERRAMAYPKERQEIMETLNSYAHMFKGTSGAKSARGAAMRIAAVTMLEALRGEETIQI